MKNKILLFAGLLFLLITGGAKAQVQCQAYFTYNNLQGNLYQFNDTSFTSSGNITSYSWTFGNGGTSTLANPNYQFQNAGWQQVCLTITTSTGCTSTYCDSINVGCNMVATIAQTGQNLLSAAVTGGTAPYTYQWIGNGAVLSTQPVLSVANTGTYCVYVTDATGCVTNACYFYQGGTSTCNAAIGYYMPPGTNVVSFWDSSSTNIGQIVSWFWDLGDGSFQNTPQFQHTYATNGVYNVCLTIQTSTGCTDTACINIVINTCGMTVDILDTMGVFMSSITGGVAPYTYLWSNGSTTSQITPSASGNYCVTVTDANGCTATDCYFYNPPATATICGQIFIDNNANGVYDAGDVIVTTGSVWGWGSGFQFSAQIDSSGMYSTNVPPGVYTIYYCSNAFNVTYTVPLNDTAGCAFYNNVAVVAGLNCGFNFGYQTNSVTVEGCVFFDANNNGIKDGGESGVAYQSVQVGSTWTYTDANGNYSAFALPGTVNISYSVQAPYTGATLTTPGTITLSGTASGNIYSNNNFGVYLPPGSNNLSVNLTPHTTVTPGFPAWYDIQVCNVGTAATGGVLNMYFDAGLTLNYASPVQSSQSGNQLAWNLPVLAPGACANYWVSFNASQSYQIGDNTYEVASVYPTGGNDVDMSNNIDTIHQIVTGSWDPNNKLPVVTNNNNPNQQIISSANADQSITYTINFQNTGTAPAVNVSVIDQLSADIVPTSFQMLNASHNAVVTRNGNNLLFRFSQVMLPDSNSNEPASHGYVTFKVAAQNGLALGHVISDDAAIYFDFNAPVITNDAAVLMVGPTAINSLSNDNVSLNVYPNPASNQATVAYQLKNSGDVQVKLTDVQGKVVSSTTVANQQAGKHQLNINANNLSNGVYMLQLTTAEQSKTLKLHISK
jgi:uncharacterized repeat protein (TIGR01451 family)